MAASTVQNNFFGIKVSKQGIPVQNASDNQLILKDDFTTRTYYDASGNVVLQEGKLSSGLYGVSSTNGQFVFSTGTIEQIIIGTLPDGTVGIVVSKPGVDVRTVFS